MHTRPQKKCRHRYYLTYCGCEAGKPGNTGRYFRGSSGLLGFGAGSEVPPGTAEAVQKVNPREVGPQTHTHTPTHTRILNSSNVNCATQLHDSHHAYGKLRAHGCTYTCARACETLPAMSPLGRTCRKSAAPTPPPPACFVPPWLAWSLYAFTRSSAAISRCRHRYLAPPGTATPPAVGKH